ncbi:uncharacterized protein L969DRAFT_43947 [Mixia osmundae IAM 14324]|uniref:Phospholipid/glycerol acyltransferase domain-containing protein n=1 Tax=Mixia osmundae (strain CBS 9802 / IAM 14324 / JCM 22182 / KY 12970) TaxID=764103 RepID=G7E2W7_MIXOS|nr:uncharacterized protein L969DRAFT_43947 [Mixia osmundae IAM 14324]KEI42565.1 hypothetical protein L969DRAFT_43947 [Mixia osmundae IAM 14324]GAA97148.1 hypothetical protein E5Q_03823 [Mixia osmundae IAM 14324]
MPFGPTHSIILQLAQWSVTSFFSESVTMGEENVPTDDGLIVCTNHWNMTVDPAVLSVLFPHGRRMHYWAKDSLFKNKVGAAILYDAGNIPVDRKNKNNQLLFAGTFDVLKLNECVSIFPEGTSYTEPQIRAIKDGASWVALEYAKNLRDQGSKDSHGTTIGGIKHPKIAVAGINYTDKSKYRSRVIMQFGETIDVEPYIDDFLKDPKPTVKRLTDRLQGSLRSLTVNAPDWDIMNAAKGARYLLYPAEADLPLRQYQRVSQALIDFLSAPKAAAKTSELKQILVDYDAALKKAGLSHNQLADYGLPSSLDPTRPIDTPTRVAALTQLVGSTLASLVRLPFFIPPLIFHLPVYTAGKLTLKYINSKEEESFAQNKVLICMIMLLVSYPVLFLLIWSIWLPSKVGAVLSFGLVWAFAHFHVAMIDDNYAHFKRLTTSWVVLSGVWLPEASGQAAQGNPIRAALLARSRAIVKLREALANADDLVPLLKQTGARSRYLPATPTHVKSE